MQSLLADEVNKLSEASLLKVSARHLSMAKGALLNKYIALTHVNSDISCRIMILLFYRQNTKVKNLFEIYGSEISHRVQRIEIADQDVNLGITPVELSQNDFAILFAYYLTEIEYCRGDAYLDALSKLKILKRNTLLFSTLNNKDSLPDFI